MAVNKVDDAELQKAQHDVTRAWLSALLQILGMGDPLDELNYWRTQVTTDDGGTYLLTLQHVSGPKIKYAQSEKEATNG